MKTFFTILWVLGLITVFAIIISWSTKRDAKLMQVYENVEPCMVDSRLPACE